MTPVGTTPPLPFPSGRSIGDLAAFDQDLVRALYGYLSSLAQRANDSLPLDGSLPMTGDLDLGGFDIVNIAAIEPTSNELLVRGTQPFINLQDTDSTGNAAASYVMFSDSANTQLGFVGNGSLSDQDIYLANSVANQNVNLLTTGTGVIDITNGGIQFPATAVAHAGANVLDDYEEGSWVVTSAGTTVAGAGTYTIQDAHYTKIGRVVYIRINIGWSAHTGTGNLRINNLPFPAGSYGAPSAFPMTTIPISGMTYAGEIQSLVLGGTSNLDIFLSASGATIAAVPMDTAMQIEIGGFYFT